MIIYEGKSRFDGKPIVCIATENSKNSKTGNMVQTWILRSDINPILASQTGEDKSVCGNCIHRGIANGINAKGRSCYVNLPFGGPNAIYRSYQEGKYKPLKDLSWFKDKFVRFGSYGEAINIPYSIVAKIAKYSNAYTGYTHGWRLKWAQPYKKFFMASIDRKEEIPIAKTLGWRYFRVRGQDDYQIAGEMQCPASKEMGYRLTCVECRACNGAKNNPNRVSVTIMAHGSPPSLANAKRNLLTLSTTKLINVRKIVKPTGVNSYETINSR